MFCADENVATSPDVAANVDTRSASTDASDPTAASPPARTLVPSINNTSAAGGRATRASKSFALRPWARRSPV